MQDPREMFTKNERKQLFRDFRRNWRHLDEEILRIPGEIYNAEVFRAKRSGIAFFEEDLISKEEKTDVSWSVFVNSRGLDHLHSTLIEFDDDDGDNEYVRERDRPNYFNDRLDLRAVPKSHNWWDLGIWKHADSEEFYGPKIYPANTLELPLFPGLQYGGINFDYETPDEWNGYHYGDFFNNYFLFSTCARSCNKHPIGMYENCTFDEKDFRKAIKRMDDRVLRAAEEGKVDLRIIRSTIEMIGEDFIPHVERVPWEWEFMLKHGRGMERLEKLLQKRQEETWRTAKDLRNVPMTHTWWSAKERRDSEKKFGKGTGNMPSFLEIFSEPRGKMLCFLEYLAEEGHAMTERETSEMVQIFLRNFLEYWKICLRYKKDPLDIMSPKEREVFNKSLYLSIPFFHLATRSSFIQSEDQRIELRIMRNIRSIRSAIQFLEDDVISLDSSLLSSWEKFKNLGEIKELDEILKKKKDQESMDMMWKDLHLIPYTHFWWPVTDRITSTENRLEEY